MTDNKALTRFFQAKHIPPLLWIFCFEILQFIFVIAHFPGVENRAANYLSRLAIRQEDRQQLKITVSNPMFQVEIDVASTTPQQKEDETDYYPHDEADELIRKHRWNTSNNKA